MGKIKEISYQYLWNLGDYQNRQIRLVAVVNEGENEDEVLMRLYHKCHRINAILQKQIELVNAVLQARSAVQHSEKELQKWKREFSDLEAELIKFAGSVEEITDELTQLERKRTVLCSRERVEELKTLILEKQAVIDARQEVLSEVVMKLSKIRKLAKSGQFHMYKPSEYKIPTIAVDRYHSPEAYDFEDEHFYDPGEDEEFLDEF
jgi:chromosome segregation ATPase